MSILIQNQTKTTWYHPNHLIPILNYTTDDFINKSTEYLKKDLERICFQGINGQKVQIIDQSNQQNIDIDTLTTAFQQSMHEETVDINLANQIKSILNQSLTYHTPNTWLVEEQMISELLTKQKLPLPGYKNSQQIVYNVNTDVAPSAKQLFNQLQGSQAYDKELEMYHASLGGYFKSSNFNTDYLVVTFQNDQAYQNFLNQINTLKPTQTIKELNDLQHSLNKNIHFNDQFYQVLFLSKKNPTDPNSMMRYMQHQLGIFTQTNQKECFITPLNVKQMYAPFNILFLSLEKMCNTSISDIEKSFAKINEIKQNNIYLINNQTLLTMDQVENAQRKDYSKNNTNTNDKAVKLKLSNTIPKKPITQKNLARMISKTFEKLTTKNISKNTYKTRQSTFMRPNRRNPDDINKAGTQTNIQYRPDIHLFIDTSGSVSEENYKSTVIMLIQVAKKLNVDLYINFFSTSLTQTTLLKVKNRNIKDIYQQFQQLPKVTGGTDYQNVWNFIDKIDKKLKTPRVYFIITDFEYSLRKSTRFTSKTPSYEKVFYIPLAIPNTSYAQDHWDLMMYYAKQFMNEMINAGATRIRNHLLI